MKCATARAAGAPLLEQFRCAVCENRTTNPATANKQHLPNSNASSSENSITTTPTVNLSPSNMVSSDLSAVIPPVVVAGPSDLAATNAPAELATLAGALIETEANNTGGSPTTLTSAEPQAASTGKRNLDNCPICEKKADYGKACKSCGCKSHYKCARIPMRRAKKDIAEFYCFICEEKNKLLTAWKNRGIGEAKGRDYFDVEAIIGYKVEKKTFKNPSGRKFCVKWTNFTATTWEPECNLDGCLDTLQKFCINKNIPISNIVGRVGAQRSERLRINMECWVTIKRIIQVATQYRNMKQYKTSLPILPSEATSNEDRIMLMNYVNHCYVILCYAKEKNGFIADGTNQCYYNKVILNEIEELTEIKLTAKKYKQQTRIDQCGAAGACITLALMKGYKNGSIPESKKLKISCALKNKIISNLHNPKQNKSQSTIRRYKLKARKIFRCNCSTQTFKTETALKNHRRLKGCKHAL